MPEIASDGSTVITNGTSESNGTSTAEVQATNADYQNTDGSTDYAGMGADIDAVLRGDLDASTLPNDINDMIVAYALGTGSLTSAMMSPEAALLDPDEVASLIDETSLEQLGDIYSHLDAAITHFLAWEGSASAEAQAIGDEASSEVDDFVNQYLPTVSTDATTGDDSLQPLFNDADYETLVHAATEAGNPGFALMVTAMKFHQYVVEANDVGADIFEESMTVVDDAISTLEGLTGDNPLDQYTAQVASNQISIAQNVFQTVQTALKALNDMEAKTSENASDEMSASFQVLRTIGRNTGA